MEAERLVAVIRRALAQSRDTPDIIAEAWQAQALAQAVGSRLAASGPKELRGEARALSEIGGRSSGALDHPAARAGVARAARLSEVADPREALTGLGALLGEVGIALVGVACETDEQSLYWQCMEAIDAADESTDRVRSMLRLLDERDRERQDRRDRGRERDGPHGVLHGPAGPMGPAGPVTGIQ
ncbi:MULTISPECIES: DUF6099 family protein [unclassified Streptomyces]|uniref:DUF6099 family protein n=1 Tax=unclassified Streptomyces TaxID=2593676 RepID=UPI00036E329D|nr:MULTISPECIES: DUF6099 family protein [unclassified Streptomyces]MYY02371.1 hypothetical protein [Streptomyces sp. SID4913]